MKELKGEKQDLFCCRCGHRIGSIKGAAEVDVVCVKCKSRNEIIFCDGRLRSEIWLGITGPAREPVTQL